MLPKLNLTGRVFNKLTVIGENLEYNKKQARRWNCQCECGNIRIASTSQLHGGWVYSCSECIIHTPNHRQYVGDLGKTYFSGVKHGAAKRNMICEISQQDAWSQFEKQNGKCALTGRDLTFKCNGEQTASLDRIDSTKGYTIDNIQWVHKDVNMMKNNFDDKFIEWAKIITKYQEEIKTNISKVHNAPHQPILTPNALCVNISTQTTHLVLLTLGATMSTVP